MIDVIILKFAFIEKRFVKYPVIKSLFRLARNSLEKSSRNSVYEFLKSEHNIDLYMNVPKC